LGHRVGDDDYIADGTFPQPQAELEFRMAGGVMNRSGNMVGADEELSVWVASFGVDEDMPKEKVEGEAVLQS